MDDFGTIVDVKKEATKEGASGAKGRFVIEPGKSRRLQRWDIFIAAVLIYVALVTPFEVAFLKTKLNWMFYVNRFIDLSFIVDMTVQVRRE